MDTKHEDVFSVVLSWTVDYNTWVTVYARQGLTRGGVSKRGNSTRVGTVSRC